MLFLTYMNSFYSESAISTRYFGLSEEMKELGDSVAKSREKLKRCRRVTSHLHNRLL